jgi:predicted PurR-regulated permease PerM
MSAGRFRFAPVLAATVLTVLAVLLLGSTAELFLLLFIAVLISLYLGAIADAVHVRTNMPRRAALVLAVLVTLALLVGFVWLLVPPVVEQTQALLHVLPTHLSVWEQGIERFIERVPALRAILPPGEHRFLLVIYDQVSGYVADLVPKLVSVFHFAVGVVAVAVMATYLALHPKLYREFLIALFPPVHRDIVRDILSDLSRSLRAFIVGQLTAMLFLGALTAAGLFALGVPYWLTFGLFTGVAAIVPFFGSLLSTILPALFVLGGDGGLTKALAVVGLGVIVHLVEGNFLAPLIMAKQVDLPPVMTILSVLIMGQLLGPVGLVVAVPVLVVVMVVVRRILLSRIYEGRGFRRVVRDRAFVVRAPAPDGGILLPVAPAGDVLADSEQRRSVAYPAATTGGSAPRRARADRRGRRGRDRASAPRMGGVSVHPSSSPWLPRRSPCHRRPPHRAAREPRLHRTMGRRAAGDRSGVPRCPTHPHPR